MSGFLFISCNYILPYACTSIHSMGEGTRQAQGCGILQKLRVFSGPTQSRRPATGQRERRESRTPRFAAVSDKLIALPL